MTDLFVCVAASELAGGPSFFALTESCAVPTRMCGPGLSYSLSTQGMDVEGHLHLIYEVSDSKVAILILGFLTTERRKKKKKRKKN